MGYRNMEKAQFAGRRLRSIKAYKVLMEMARGSMDDDRPPVYFGGWRRLAFVLGHDVSDAPGTPTGPDKVASNAVGVAQRALLDEGVIRRVRDPRARGKTAAFELLIDATNAVANPPETRGSAASETHGLNPSETHGLSPSETHGHRNKGGTKGSKPEERTHPPTVTTERPRGAADDGDGEIIIGGAGSPHRYAPDDSALYCRCGRPQPHRVHDVAVA